MSHVTRHDRRDIIITGVNKYVYPKKKKKKKKNKYVYIPKSEYHAKVWLTDLSAPSVISESTSQSVAGCSAIPRRNNSPSMMMRPEHGPEHVRPLFPFSDATDAHINVRD
jgi:hypothetical protein